MLGGREDICGHVLSRKSLRVNITCYELRWKVKVMIE